MGVYISGLKMPQDGRITLQIDSTGGRTPGSDHKGKDHVVQIAAENHGCRVAENQKRNRSYV